MNIACAIEQEKSKESATEREGGSGVCVRVREREGERGQAGMKWLISIARDPLACTAASSDLYLILNLVA